MFDTENYEKEKAVEKIIGYKFRNILLLRRALTHNSYVAHNDEHMKTVGDYQRLEYLGDALLNFIVAEKIYYLHPDYDEGLLTKVRAAIVSKAPLAEAIDKHGITEQLYCNVPLSVKMKSDILESIAAAIYVDSNSIDNTRAFVMLMLGDEIAKIGAGDAIDYKTKMYERCAADKSTLKFNLIETSGYAHKLSFTYELTVNGVTLATATGSSKRAAQQACSKIALEKLAESNGEVKR